jgi:hypothetical protein
MSIDYLDIINKVSIINPKAIILDGLDEAIVGMSESSNPIFIYSTELCISIMMRDNDWEYLEAVEFLEYNTFNTYYGDYSPTFVCEAEA